MKHLIDKDALVAEIKKRLLPVVRDKHYDEWEEGQDSERKAILGIIGTLEVKEVDLEKEIQNLWSLNQKYDNSLFIPMNYGGFCGIAKHFFELGLKAQKGE